MLLSLAFENPLAFIIMSVALISALTIHEFAHALSADFLGDPTPRVQGRLTLNPLAHLDPLGTILLFIAGFGWGKPVIFDPYNLRHPKRDTALIAFAGPLSNIILAFIGFMIIPLLSLTWQNIAYQFSSINILLAAFNLIPITPLDGSKILTGLLPHRLAYEYEETMKRYGFFILILFVLPLVGGTSPMSFILRPLITGIEMLLLLITRGIWSLVR